MLLRALKIVLCVWAMKRALAMQWWFGGMLGVVREPVDEINLKGVSGL